MEVGGRMWDRKCSRKGAESSGAATNARCPQGCLCPSLGLSFPFWEMKMDQEISNMMLLSVLPFFNWYGSWRRQFGFTQMSIMGREDAKVGFGKWGQINVSNSGGLWFSAFFLRAVSLLPPAFLCILSRYQMTFLCLWPPGCKHACIFTEGPAPGLMRSGA